MSDSVQDIARDLARFVKQQQQEGVEWYLDEGPPAEPEPAPAAEAPAPVDAEPEPVAAEAPTPPPAPEPAPKPEPKPAPAPAAPAAPADQAKQQREAEFIMARDRFVTATLEQIAQRAPVEVAAPLAPEQKAAALADMAAEVAACEACKLHPTRTRTVFGVGDPDANIVFIGEAPGRNEDEQGEPFVGRAGKLLNDILKAIGFAREDVYICNILKCRPPENRDPEADEVRECEPFLKRQLEIIQPKVICCLGRHAAMTLLQTKASLKSMREVVHFYEGVPVMATFHPAALLRNPNWKRDTWDDVRKMKALHDALLADS